MFIVEGTAGGALVLTDSVANGLGELFETGSEIVTYADDTDLLNKIAYYLERKDECEAIARAGYSCILAHHTYAHRMKIMLDITQTSSFKRLAPMRTARPETRLAARRRVYTHLHMLDTILDTAQAIGKHGPPCPV